MLTMVPSIEEELSLQSSTEWEGSAEQTLLCLSLPGLLLLGTSSRLGALVPVWEHRAALPEIPKGSLASRSSHSLPSHLHITSPPPQCHPQLQPLLQPLPLAG